MQLPEGAVFKLDSAQAHTVVWMLSDTVYIESKCDSLQSLLIDYERKLDSLSDETIGIVEEKNTAEITPKDKFSLKWFCIGIVAGIVFTIILILVCKK